MHSPQAAACAPFPLSLAAKRFVSRVSWPLALGGQFVVVVAVVALSGPGRIDIVDGQTRYEVARSLVDHGDSIVRDEAAWFTVFKGRDGQRYSNYRIPQSVLGVAAIRLADATGPVDEARRQFFFALISPCLAGVLAVVYALWFRGLGHGPGASLAWSAAGIFCTPNWYYSTSTFDDILGTVAVVGAVAVAWLSRDRRPVVGSVAAGLALAWAVNCKPPLALFALAVLAAGYRPGVALRRQLVPAGVVALGIVVGVVFGTAYHAYKFPPGSDDIEAEAEKLYGPVITPNPLPGLASLALSPSCGALWYCPTLFLSWRGWCAWRTRRRGFCQAVLAVSCLFVLSISFLSFFKGEPCWGPRYLTPVFALWWVFVPAALTRMRGGAVGVVLALGMLVQLLGLSVDPHRLFLSISQRWDYYRESPWLGFDGSISHLVQRPRELVEMWERRDYRAPEFSPGPLPTHAGSQATAAPALTSLVGLLSAPGTPGTLNGVASLLPTFCLQQPHVMKQAVSRYHIYNTPRPWMFSQWYLAEEARPVDLGNTMRLLAGLGAVGLLLMGPGVVYRFARNDDSLSPDY
jgi:hypothetical protein